MHDIFLTWCCGLKRGIAVASWVNAFDWLYGRILEGSHSGLVRLFAKQLTVKAVREFESLPLRS